MPRIWDAALLDFHRHVDELFEELIYRPWAISGRSSWRPLLDLHETADAFIVEIDLPDVAPEEIRIVVGERSLTVSGQRPLAAPEGVVFQHCERQRGTFQRAVPLPASVDPQRARAEYRLGTCRVWLPRKPAEEHAGTPGEPESYCVVHLTIP